MKLRGGMLVVGLLLLGRLAAAEPAAGDTFLERLKAAARTAPAPAPADDPAAGVNASNITRSVVLIGSSQGRGSGFLCRIWGMPVIVTNAHVYAQMTDSSIEDGLGHRYEPKAALVSRKRDLALVEVDLPSDRAVFELMPNVGESALDTTANAYGDSLGDRVVTMLEGKLISIGPDEIEVSAGIVPGNSGGPVVNADYRVIGVSSYLKILSRDSGVNILDGTRFGDARKENTAVRRFAIRIDNLDPEEFERFDPKAQKRDLEIYRALARANADFLAEVKALQGFDAWLLFFRKYHRLNFAWNYDASLTFLDRLLEQEKMRTAVLAGLFSVPPATLTAPEQRQADSDFRQLARYRRDTFRCNACNGNGGYVRSSRNGSEVIRCAECYGLGRAERPYYQYRGMPLSVRTPQFRIAGIAPGMDLPLVRRQLKLGKETDVLNVNGIFQLCRFRGNPAYPAAKSTALTFVAKRLSYAMIRFNRDRGLWDELKKDLTAKLGKPAADFGDGGKWGYVLYCKPGGTVTLSTYDLPNFDFGLRISMRHNILTQLEFRLLESLGNQLFVPLKPGQAQPEGFFL